MIALLLLVLLLVCFFWVKGIDYMDDKHPHYKGEDLFGEDEGSYDEIYNNENK